MSEETVLVLGGGGAKGAYQAEVACRIFDSLNVKAVTGISAGALNGAILSQGKLDRLSEIWAETRKDDVWSGGHTFWRYWDLLRGNKLGLYDSEPLYEQVRMHFDPNLVEIPFRAGAVSLETGKYVPYQIDPDESYGERQIEMARKFVCASAAVPGAVEPVDVSKDLQMMIDGGTRNMAPISDALDFDPDKVVAILNTDIGSDLLEPRRKPSHIFDVAGSALEILLNETTVNDISTARNINEAVEHAGGQVGDYEYIDIDVIEPSGNIGSPRDFSKEAHENRVRIARRDAQIYLNS